MSDDGGYSGGEYGGGGPASRTVASGAKFELPGLEEATTQIRALNEAISSLSTNLKGISANQGQHTDGVKAITSAITGGSGQSGYMPPANYPVGTGSDSGSDLTWLTSQLSNMGSSPISNVASMMTLPMKYAFNRVEQNRATTRNLSYDLSRVSTMSGTGIEGILKMLANQTPVMGSAEDITGAMNIGAANGYFNMNSARSGAYYTSIRQMQQLQPSTSAPEAATQMAGALNNTRQQQQAMMLTGGAMGNFGAGGVPKTLSEWAESTLRWFEGQRPGKDRGKAFTKEELASQVFPGSNMNAWFSATNVQPYMVDYFWQYAMGKVQSGGTTQTQMKVEDIVAQRGGDLGLATLQTSTANARRDFVMSSQGGALGGQSMYQAYLTRESTDRDFTNMMSQMVDKSVASMLGGVLGQMFAKIPTPIAGMMEQQLTNLPGMVEGAVGLVTGGLGNAISSLTSMIPGMGDPEFMIGDAGTYGPLGGTGTAGMTPDMAKRVNAMMAANPNIRIASGFRDGGLQGRLHANGVGMTAPAGHSMHGRGLAADLGPSSQYGWIAKNASRFGLDSGQGAGEPWHVGFPGTVPKKNFMTGDPEYHIGDIFSSIGGGISSIVGGLGNIGSTIFQGATSLLSGDWSGLFGSGGPFDVAGIASGALGGLFSLLGIPALLNPLSGAGAGSSAKDFAGAFGGLLTSGNGGLIKPNLTSSLSASGTSPGSAGGAGGAASGTPGVSSGVAGILQKYGGGHMVAAANESANTSKILATLAAAQAAGFSGDELVTIASIAGRESSWNPAAHNNNAATGDDSYGLYQINMLGSLGAPRRAQFGISSNAQLLDANIASKAAFSLTGGGHNFSPWGGYKGMTALHGAEQFVQPVYDLAKSHGFIGDPGYSPAYSSMAGGGMAQINVSNSIAVNASGTSPASLRSTAEQLAQFTTDSIRKQMSRST